MTITLQSFPAGPNGFFRAPVLLTGPTEAVLIDGGFTLSDGKAVADAITASGKTLTTIYISQSDPDYYFSLLPIKTLFPNAKVLAASATIAAINASVQKKLDVWGPQLKTNGPQTLADVVIPTAFDGTSLTVDGETIDIVSVSIPNRRYLSVPSLGAIVGGVLVFSGVHVWVADTPTPEQRAVWIGILDGILAQGPKVVVPGHMKPDAAVGVDAVRYTRDYLVAFEAERAKAATSAELNAAMRALYPNAGMEVALDIGAKVVLGEMKWG